MVALSNIVAMPGAAPAPVLQPSRRGRLPKRVMRIATARDQRALDPAAYHAQLMKLVEEVVTAGDTARVLRAIALEARHEMNDLRLLGPGTSDAHARADFLAVLVRELECRRDVWTKRHAASLVQLDSLKKTPEHQRTAGQVRQFPLRDGGRNHGKE